MISNDLLSPNAINDPYTYFRSLREHDPIHWNDEWGGWILTRYADVMAGFQDNRLSSARMSAPRKMSQSDNEKYATTFSVLSNWMVFNNPPKHTRLRKLVSQAFTPREVKKMEPKINEITDRLLGQLHGPEINILAEYSNILPILVISEMLGLPAEDHPLIKKWSDNLMLVVFGALDVPDRHERAQKSLKEMVAYLEDAIAERKKNPREDLLTSIIQASDDGDLLTSEEIISTCSLLVFGGHETTTNLIANGIYSLLKFPDQLEKLRAQPELIKPAVEEFLRFESPSKSQVRIAGEDLLLDGNQIKKGQRILLVQAAANRDPDKFLHPDQLDITRKPNLHVAFGKGIHFCLGAPLARLEGEIAIQKMMNAFPNMQLKDSEQEWQSTIIARGLTSLRVLV